MSITAPPPWDPPPYTDSYKPEGKLSDFDGLNAKGTWQLKIRDVNPADVGILKSWSLIIDFQEPTPINPKPADVAQNVAVNAALSWDTESGTSGVTWDVYVGTDPNALQVAASGLTIPHFCPGELDNGITYFWQVVAKKACVTTPGPVWSFKTFVYKIIWVSFHGADDVPSAGAVGAGFAEAPDRGYTDLLKASGYDVVRYVQTGTPDVNLLNAADLVIVSRSVASGSFSAAAADRWNTQITAPMIITNGYLTRKSRLGFMTGSTIPDSTGDIMLTVSDPTHPIFAGIELTDGTMNNPFAGICTYPDGVTLARGISIITEAANAEGNVLATVPIAASATAAPAPAVMIAEWQPGATLTHDGGAGTNVLAGRRLVFLTGSREASGKNSEGTGMIDLSPNGQKVFINAVRYMLGIQPVEIPVENYSFELPGTAKIKGWNAEGIAGTPAEDIPAWSSDAAATDSGVESDWPGHTDGVWTGFLRGTDPSTWNLTDFVIKASDDFILYVDARDNWTESASMPAKLQMTLYYLVDGVRTPLATTTVELTTTWNTFSLAFTANSVPAAVGSEIGIELTNATATNNSWIGMDNVHLFDLSGEQPLELHDHLKLDINTTNTDPAVVEPGFTSFTLADSNSVVNGIKVGIAGINAADSRRRGAPVGIPYEQIYRDFVFGRLPTAGPGVVTVTLSGLLPNRDYEITLYSFDINSDAGGPRIADWTANGEFVFETVMDATVPPTAADSYAFSAWTKSDATGTIVLVGLPAANTAENQPFAFINALVLSSTVCK